MNIRTNALGNRHVDTFRKSEGGFFIFGSLLLVYNLMQSKQRKIGIESVPLADPRFEFS
jgi:hypothetical protein